MGVIKFSRAFDVDANFLWMVVSDFSRVDRLCFQVSSTELLSEQDHGLHSERKCTRYDGRTSIEKVTSWIDSERSYEIECVDGLPFDYGTVTIQVIEDAVDPEKSYLNGTFEYCMKWGPVGKVFEMLFARSQLTEVFELYMGGVDYHLKTGKSVPENFTLDMIPNYEEDETHED